MKSVSHLICALSPAAEHIFLSTQPFQNNHQAASQLDTFSMETWHLYQLEVCSTILGCVKCFCKLFTQTEHSSLHSSLSLAGRLGLNCTTVVFFFLSLFLARAKLTLKIKEESSRATCAQGWQSCWFSKLHINNFCVITWHDRTWNSVLCVRIDNTAQIPQLHHRTSKEWPNTSCSYHTTDKSWGRYLACPSEFWCWVNYTSYQRARKTSDGDISSSQLNYLTCNEFKLLLRYLEEISQIVAWSEIWGRKQNHFQVKDLKYKGKKKTWRIYE